MAGVYLAKLLLDNGERLSSWCRSSPSKLYQKMLRKSVLSDGTKNNLFRSLDSRVDPQLKVRYLLRLISARVCEDESVWETFMSLLNSLGEKQMYYYLSELTSALDTEVWYDCASDFTTFLTSEDIQWILEVLVPATPKWELIARALNVHTSEIQNCRKHSNKLSLDSVISFWIDRKSDTRATIDRLLIALRSDLVEERRVAQRLERTYEKLQLNSLTKHSNESFSNSCDTDLVNDVHVTDGKSTLLQVQGSFIEPDGYQWEKDGQPLTNSLTYSGVNEDLLVIRHASQGTEGEYSCSVLYGGMEKSSHKVTLTVIYPSAKKQLLDLYSFKREVPEDSWPPVGTKCFINLVLVQSKSYLDAHKDADARLKVDYDELFGTYKSRTLIIMEGRPGSGKTTLINKLVKDWNKGTALRNSKFVFLVTLRIVNQRLKEETLSNLLRSFYYSEDMLKIVCYTLEESKGEGVCFIIDGLDEYRPQDKETSLIFRLIDKTFLPLAMIIVASRPVGIKQLREETITHKVEVLGFSQEQILEYIDSFPFASSSHDPDTASTNLQCMIKEYLHSHPVVYNMCHLPVHAAIICFLFKYHQGNVPNTQTKIYQDFIRSAILRQLRCHDPDAQVHSLTKLAGSTKDSFSKLCKLAFNMTMHGRQIATPEVMDDELSDYVSRNSDEWGLGLVAINHIAELSGFTKSYSFLHLTVQEFLAAYFITGLDAEKQRELIYNFINMFSPVAVFYFGLMHFHSGHPIFRDFNQMFSRLVFFCRCAVESQQKVVCDQIAECHEGSYKMSNLIPSDLYALSYVMLNASHPITGIRLGYDVVKCDYTNFFLHVSCKDFSNLQSLVICERLGNVDTLALCDLLKSYSGLIVAKLSFQDISPDGAKAITDWFKNAIRLKRLIISCYCTSGGIVALFIGLAQLGSIELLKLSFFHLDSKGVFEIGSGLQLLHNGVVQLAVEQCEVDDIAAMALGHGLVNMGYLTMSKNSISTTLPIEIHRLTNLTVFDLSHSNIGCYGATTLASKLEYLTQLLTLDLSYNDIGPHGAVSLANVLHHLTKLLHLNLSHNSIGPRGAYSLANKLHFLVKMFDLNLSYNEVDLSSAIAVITASKNCPHISRIKLGNSDCEGRWELGIHVHVQGLVSPEDTNSMTLLIASSQHPTLQRDLHLGFKSISLKPLDLQENQLLEK